MGIRWGAAVAGLLVSGPALAEDASRLQLALLAPPLGHQRLEQPLQGPMARDVVAEPRSAPTRAHPSHAAKVQHHVPSAPQPAAMDGLGVGYSLFFGPSAGQIQPGAPVDTRPNPQAAEEAIWTVLNGPAGHRTAASLARAAEVNRPAELLVALRAGF